MDSTMKKYELTEKTKELNGRTLHRIRALVAVGDDVEAGDLGGWVESETSLSQEGNAWVFGNALVYGNARLTATAHYLTIGPIGSRDSTTTFFRGKDRRIYVACGFFRGDLDAFRAAVSKTHGDNRHAKAYLAAIELAKLQIIEEAKEE